MTSYTENVADLDSKQNYWFSANNLDTLYYFLDEAIDYEDYSSSLRGELNLNTESVTSDH